MAAIKEYRCVAHDLEFESTEDAPSCPSGCHPRFVVREFRTPFSIGTNVGRTVDHYAKQLASDYGLTDMRNDRDQSVMQTTRRESGGMREIGPPGDRRMVPVERCPTWAPSIFRPNPGWARTGDVPSFKMSEAGLKAPGNDRYTPLAQTKLQLDVAKTTLRQKTLVEKRWKQ